jgi:hypothetical protein
MAAACGSSFFLPTGCDAALARHGRIPFVSSCPLCHNDNQVRRGMPFTLVKSLSLSCNFMSLHPLHPGCNGDVMKLSIM